MWNPPHSQLSAETGHLLGQLRLDDIDLLTGTRASPPRLALEVAVVALFIVPAVIGAPGEYA
jgi:hypothetical protein